MILLAVVIEILALYGVAWSIYNLRADRALREAWGQLVRSESGVGQQAWVDGQQAWVDVRVYSPDPPNENVRWTGQA